MRESLHAVPESSRNPRQLSPTIAVGDTLGMIGFFGAVATIAIVYAMTSNPLESDPTNAFVPLANGISTLVAAGVFIVGGLISVTTSTIGLFLSSGIGSPKKSKSVTGMALCVAGPLLLIGYFLLFC